MSAKWTVMVYVAGYNNLTEFAGKDLAEMRKVGSSDDLKVAVFVKRLEQQAAHRIIVGKGGRTRSARTSAARSTPAHRRPCSTSSAGRTRRRPPSATRS